MMGKEPRDTIFSCVGHGLSNKNDVSPMKYCIGGIFLVKSISNITKHRKNMPNREVQRLPKGGWGASAGSKNHRSDGGRSNFWWSGAAQSILDNKILRN